IQKRKASDFALSPRMPLEGLLALVAPQSLFKQKGVNVMHNEATFWTEGREEGRGEIEKEGRHGKERRKVRMRKKAKKKEERKRIEKEDIKGEKE
ncbi:hypothetical protein E2320_013113, partial [Naja naja]